ncbi:hypothetical protein EDB80DRAFT_701226 [Ilyonectria destructans]|nr:hypothetical protein EDB80DRAFT_701226 [Ilyonectria destructans]
MKSTRNVSQCPSPSIRLPVSVSQCPSRQSFCLPQSPSSIVTCLDSSRRANQCSKFRRSMGGARRAVAGVDQVVDDYLLSLDGLVVPLLCVGQLTNPLLWRRHLFVEHLASPLWVQGLFVLLVVREVFAPIHGLFVVLILVHAVLVPLQLLPV